MSFKIEWLYDRISPGSGELWWQCGLLTIGPLTVLFEYHPNPAPAGVNLAFLSPCCGRLQAEPGGHACSSLDYWPKEQVTEQLVSTYVGDIAPMDNQRILEEWLIFRGLDPLTATLLAADALAFTDAYVNEPPPLPSLPPSRYADHQAIREGWARLRGERESFRGTSVTSLDRQKCAIT